jgi:phage shock protein PspC (stress-responsive transcriptional regulator)
MPQQTPSPGDTESPGTESTPPTSSTGAPGSGTPGDVPFDGQTPPPMTGNRFFTWMRSLGIQREPGWIGGVSAGIAGRLGIDPLIVRGIIVVVAVLGGPALLLYAAAWLLLPDAANKIHLEEVFRGKLEAPIAGIGAMLLFALLPASQGFWMLDGGYWYDGNRWGDSFGSFIWTVVVLGLIIWLVVWIARRSNSSAAASSSTSPTASAFAANAAGAAGAPTQQFATATDAAAPPAPPTLPAPVAGAPAEEFAAWREQQELWKAQSTAFRQQQASARQAAVRAAQEQARAERNARYAAERAARARTRSHPLYTLAVIGLAVVVGGLTIIGVSQGTVTTFDIPLGFAAALGVLALGIIVNGVRGKRGGGASAVAIIIVVFLAFSSIFRAADVRFGEETFYEPVNRAGSEIQTYVVPFGDVTLDLTDYYERSGTGSDNVGSADSVLLAAGAADVTVIVPNDEYVRIDSELGSGEIITETAPDAGTYGDYSSSSLAEYRPTGSENDEWNGTDRLLHVDVRLGTGSITIIKNTEGVSE